MRTITKPDFGKCPYGGHFDNRWVEVRMTVDNKDIRLKDVPQGACPQCGSRVYKSETLLRIEALMKEHK